MFSDCQTPLQFFVEISKIPRVSLHEEKIADALVAFATKKGLWCYRDAAHNVLVKKPATKGREAEPAVLLQAHTDMVAEKRPDVSHDFLTEGLELHGEEGPYLFANGTTLGADDGFGVAMMLAILASNTLSHPALECLFTSAEEIGLVGASQFDYSNIHAKFMVNLDSAEEDTVIVGCCGGLRSKIRLPMRKIPAVGAGFTLTVGGLCGGHSGEDIHRGRLNALSLMGKLLRELGTYTEFCLSYLHGGDKSNAIPRDCTASVLVWDRESALRFAKTLPVFAKSFVAAEEDKGLTVFFESDKAETALDKESTEALLTVLDFPGGILKMRQEPPIMPRASRNLASVRLCGEEAVFVLSARSAHAADIEENEAAQRALAERLGGEISFSGRYPGWESGMDTPLVKAWCRCFEEITKKKTTPTLIHAGLETGLITSAVAGLSAIAVGPNIHDLHTPQERMELASFERMFAVLTHLLETGIR